MPYDGSDLSKDQIIAGIHEELDKRRRNRPAGGEPLWWPAIEVAERFGIRPHGSEDSRKRGVRIIMRSFRLVHSDFIACTHGYALAANADDLLKYEQVLRNNGLTQVIRANQVKQSQAMDDATGQLRLPPEADKPTRPAAEPPPAETLF